VGVYKGKLRDYARELDVLVHGEVTEAMVRLGHTYRDHSPDDDSYLSKHASTLQRFWGV
jgi:hypothetical protein